MNSSATLALSIALSVLSLLGGIHSVTAQAYTVSAWPPTINLGGNTTITLSESGGNSNELHTFDVVVTKPGGSGVTTARISFTTDGSGAGIGSVQYPSTSFTGIGTVSTNVAGNYTIRVDRVSPNPLSSIATGSFTVDTELTVTIGSPQSGSNLRRGSSVTITANVNNIDGSPNNLASVQSITPSGSIIPLARSLVPGTYSATYIIQYGDTLGPWTITVTATESGNIGSNSTTASVLPAQLIVPEVTAYDSQGVPRSEFSPGDTILASFRLQYTNGPFLNTGSYSIQIRTPSGATTGTVLVMYDSVRGLFYTPSGYSISSSHPDGTWQLFIPMGSLDDGLGNTGPSTSIAYSFQVRQNQSTIGSAAISPFYFLIAALAAGGGLTAAVSIKRLRNKAEEPFEHLFKLAGGDITPPASLMIIGDPGAGTTALALQLLHWYLASGNFCGLITYDSFPSEIKTRMMSMGWDVGPALETEQLKILDCYSSLAGVEDAPIKDPTDFTELSIQVSGLLDHAQGRPVYLFLDSVTSIFNSASAKECINFLQVLGAKVKKSGGLFVLTGTKGSIPEDARLKIESLAEGVIELNLRTGERSPVRSLIVRKMSGREISPKEVRFKIVWGKGILFKN